MNRFADAFTGIKYITVLFAAVGVVFASPTTAVLLWLLAAGMHGIDSLPVRDEE